MLFPMLAGVGDASARAAFVVGKDGVIKYAEQTPTPTSRPYLRQRASGPLHLVQGRVDRVARPGLDRRQHRGAALRVGTVVHGRELTAGINRR